MKTKTEIDGQHPSSNYLVVGDSNEPSAWHLRIRNASGQLDHKLMGDAWAALHEGFRGRKYQGPDKDEAIRKLVALYHSEGMTTPDGQAPPQPVSNRGNRLLIRNRMVASRPGWIHIVPRGELYNPEADLTQVFDDQSLDSILNRLEAEKANPSWPGIYLGREHFIYNAEKDSEALGWLKNFDRNADGIWAKDDGLTDIGREAVKNGRYKFSSLVADRKDLQKLANGRYRVLAIETVGLTNLPVGRELIAPITNRRGATDENGVSYDTGLPVATSAAQGRENQANADRADGMESDAVGKWFECVGHILTSCRKNTGRHFDFGSAWALAKAKNPDLYKDAFGAPENDGPAASEVEANTALQEVSTLANRVKTAARMDFQFGWKFVKENLPHVFNRQFVARSPVANRTTVEEGNMAGVQKRAEKLFMELVQAEQTLYGISFTYAFNRVKNRETTLRDLANYTIAPKDAFARQPGLRDKLLNTASRGTEPKPIDERAVRGNANMLYNDLIRKEMEAGASQQVAYRKVMNKHTILCKLVNREITPKGAFVLEPELRAKLT